MRKIILAGSSLSLVIALSNCVGDAVNTAGNAPDSGTSELDGSMQQPGVDSGNQMMGMDSGMMMMGDTGVDAGPSIDGKFVNAFVMPAVGGLGYISNVAVSATDIVLIGFITGSVTINGLTYTAMGNGRDVFVMDLQRSNYGVKFVKTYGTADDDWPNGVGIDATGNIYVSGYVNGATNVATGNVAFGAKSLPLKHIDAHSFVLKLDSTGVAQWVVGFDNTTANGGYRTDCNTLAVSPAGNIGVGCNVSGTLSFATGAASTDTRPYLNGSITNVFLAELEPTNGYVTWAQLIQGGSSDGVAQVAYDSKNNFYAMGTTSSNPFSTTDTPTFSIAKSGASSAGWIAKIAAGTPRTLGFTQSWSGAQIVNATGLALDAKDNPFVSGTFASTINFGGTASLTAGGSADAFLLALNPSTGATVAQQQVGASGNGVAGPAIAVDDIGDLDVATYFAGSGFTLGGTMLPASVTNQDDSSFLAKFPPSLGAAIYAQPSTATPDDGGSVSGIRFGRVVSNGGDAFIVGQISGSGNLGDGKTLVASAIGTTFLLQRAR